jgi:hypothetical protein
MSGSTNFQQWNPNQNNQESDADYGSDGQRANGATTGIFPSRTANKAFYQWSTFVTALATALVAKGYTVVDTTLSGLQAVFAKFVTQADLILVSVNYSATPVFDCSLSPQPVFEIILTGNPASSTLPNSYLGQEVTFIIRQDATGGRVMAWPANLVNPGALDSSPNSTNIQKFVCAADGAFRPVTGMTVS